MLTELGLVALGLALLVAGGEALVRGAVNLSLRLGLSPLLVGLTVVAFGTSAPELLVSVEAVLDGAPGIALGNVVGSNIANVLLVLGIPAIIAGVRTADLDLARSFVTMLASTVLFVALALLGPFGTLHSAILLCGLVLMIWDSARDGARRASPEEPVEGADPSMPIWRVIAFLVAGLVMLPLGARFLVEGATGIAREMGVGETVIGLTLVAVGTSLPELATSVIAAFRNQAEVAMGNVIGSNVFNLLGIIGIAGLVGPLPVPVEMMRYDLWVMLGVSFLLVPFVFGRRDITRRVGLGLVAAYAAYVASVIL